jgi:uncharacterized protein YjbI with pentapeptide repeats
MTEAAPKEAAVAKVTKAVNKTLAAAKAKAGVVRPDIEYKADGKDFSGVSFKGRRLKDVAQEKFYGEEVQYWLKNCNFNGADLSGADATGIIFQGSTFKGTNLRGADLTGADFRWCDFAGAETDE